MALPTPTASGPVPITNPGLEAGTTEGWTLGAGTALATDITFAGEYSLKYTGTGGTTTTLQETLYPVYPGMTIKAGVMYQQGAASAGRNTGTVILQWYDASGNVINPSTGNTVTSGAGGAWTPSNVTGSAPSNAAGVRLGVNVFRDNNSPSWADNFSWDYNFSFRAELTSPTSEYSENENIPVRITITPAGNVSVIKVQYVLMTQVDGEFLNPTTLAELTEAPYAFNAPALAIGTYAVYAVVSLSNGATVVSNSRTFSVVDAPDPETREYKASNSYTYLVGESFVGLSSGIPSTAQVTGVETELTYSLEVRVRAKDNQVTDPEQYTSSVAFDVINGGVFESSLFSKADGSYTQLGSPQSANVSISQADFTVTQDGVADGQYRWTVYTGDSKQNVLVGDAASVFNIGTIPATDFLNYAMGIRFYPTVNSKPSYAAEGDAAVRVKVDKWKARVYFDAGSVEYYFASSDKSQVIKGELVAYNVNGGNFSNSDASGVLQLAPDLEIIDGSQSYIGDNWTIHSGYPVTDLNEIGDVAPRDPADGIGMSYNSMPTQLDVYNNRSRYVFITANFYGDTELESIYGANGVDRAFAYNGKYFYNIQTQVDLSKDKPRHVAFHHSHLALGFLDGRVDISVVGEPYNFNGVDGASSWAIGDKVTGLLPLGGSILGVFCQKSIVGIAGTTVDNFATQNLSASMGAVEYTITDMGYPIYANAYGVYTLAQTQEYGDYLGTPLSQPVSPWLRPRLVRKYTSNKEVVVAWPVRSKNQYKLAFADGYVLSMTMNYGQQSAPTFAKQKYFITEPAVDYSGVDLLEYPAIYPIAVSSQLDEGGEERIHIANLSITEVEE